ncbi:nitronate monooxygenase [Gulosibacter sediminis]|uniref:nitronate monooxygenase n=1 Tax=Gulosibacter sediminis TaxID=1729695 RepID=UPI0024ACA4CC|nr:nitronate monooxygenase [Gulosibacter sediminis]
MIDLHARRLPVVQAPMAGGPTTPELVAAVSNFGALGTLAGGYLSAEAFAEKLAATRALTAEPFAVNLFVPESTPADVAAAERYRERLIPLAERLGVEVPEVCDPGDDAFFEKIEALEASPVPLVTFTFGMPDLQVVKRLRAVGTAIGVTIASVEDAVMAFETGPEVLIVQGPAAGGHRANFDQSTIPDSLSLDQLLARILPLARVARASIIATGGIDTPERARSLLDAGADAVALGTAFLTVQEAGTRPPHREALLAGTRETVVTRAYSGRNARGLRNRFIDEFDLVAPASYPIVHFLTKPIRDASSDSPEYLNLWAGENYRSCRDETTEELLSRFSEAL